MSILQFGARMTVFTLPSSNLVIYSAIPYNDKMITEMGKLIEKENETAVNEDWCKRVKYIVIPDLEHTMALISFKIKYPDIKVIGLEGCNAEVDKLIDFKVHEPNKVLKQMEILNMFKSEGNQNVPPEAAEFADNFQLCYLPGHPNHELTLYHRESKTLAEGDLIFNLTGDPHSEALKYCSTFNEQFGGKNVHQWSSFITRSLNPYSKLYPKLIKKMFPPNEKNVKALKDMATQWHDMERIVMCHGEVVESNGVEFFKQAFKGYS